MKTVGSNENILRSEFTEELIGAHGLFRDGYAKDTVPVINPLNRAGSLLENRRANRL